MLERRGSRPIRERHEFENVPELIFKTDPSPIILICPLMTSSLSSLMTSLSPLYHVIIGAGWPRDTRHWRDIDWDTSVLKYSWWFEDIWGTSFTFNFKWVLRDIVGDIYVTMMLVTIPDGCVKVGQQKKGWWQNDHVNIKVVTNKFCFQYLSPTSIRSTFVMWKWSMFILCI